MGFRLREKEQNKLQRPNLLSEWLLRSPGGLLSAVHFVPTRPRTRCQSVVSEALGV